MATNVTVQRMTVKDARTCWELDQRCFADGEAYDLDTFHYLLSNPQVVARKVELMDGTMIGFAVGMIEPGAVGHVISVGVAPEWRRRGVGKFLMEDIERGFAKRDATICRLEVRTDNRVAQQLYLKLGYTITQQLPNYYANGDDALVMVKTLPQRRLFWRFGY
ncbi:MAG: ribosomal protein S18-alanine N-acetyltransferase [Acidobacteria bacterium]|nr:ribosomal protein S18-alanine N-acetyltransferase [Acidobacteriota bacterium]